MVMYWFYVWGAWFYFSWFHTFLVKGRGLSETEMGVVSGAAYLLGAIGNMAGGALSDRLSRRHGFVVGRRWVATTALALSAACILATAMSHTKPLVIVF